MFGFLDQNQNGPVIPTPPGKPVPPAPEETTKQNLGNIDVQHNVQLDVQASEQVQDSTEENENSGPVPISEWTEDECLIAIDAYQRHLMRIRARLLEIRGVEK